jgi:glycine dehydrogenase subunit 1
VLDHLLQHDIFGGYDLSKEYPELENCLMLAVTEKMTRENIDYLCDVLEEVDHA